MTEPPAQPNITHIAGSIGWLDVDVDVERPVADAPESPEEDKSAWKFTPETLLGVIGAAAAIGLWINVVGAGVLWARFDAAELPASQVVGIVPNSTLLGLGIRALALPLLAAVVAVAVYYILTRQRVTQPVTLVEDKPSFMRQFRPMLRAAWKALKGAKHEQLPAEPDDDPPARHESSGAGAIGGVIVLLAVLALIAIFVMFGGDASTPKHPEYLVAWAIASPFLVFGAATYDPVNRALAPMEWREAALFSLALVSAVAIGVTGLLVDEFAASLPVAALPVIAAILAGWLPPGYRLGRVTAGVLLLLAYVAGGAALYFVGGGRLTFALGDQGVPLVVTIVLSTLALLFLFSVDARSTRAVTIGIMFAVVAAWGGAAGFLRERKGDPAFELTAMVRKPESLPNNAQRDRSPVSGFLIARTGDAVLVATSSAATDPTWRIVVVARDQIEAMSIGPSCEVNPQNLEVADGLADELAAEGTGSPTACEPSR